MKTIRILLLALSFGAASLAAAPSASACGGKECGCKGAHKEKAEKMDCGQKGCDCKGAAKADDKAPPKKDEGKK